MADEHSSSPLASKAEREAEYFRKRYLERKQRILPELRNRYASDPAYADRVRARVRAYRARNLARIQADQRDYCARNSAKQVAKANEWRKKNIDKARATTRRMNARRYAATLKATPVWADLSAIKAIYDRCAEIQVSSGIRHEVDHIVPLKNPLVCGLHVESNLRIVTMQINRKKGNKHGVHGPAEGGH
jgi:5-methylcytosine-specific restriction endonuclease McrA